MNPVCSSLRRVCILQMQTGNPFSFDTQARLRDRHLQATRFHPSDLTRGNCPTNRAMPSFSSSLSRLLPPKNPPRSCTLPSRDTCIFRPTEKALAHLGFASQEDPPLWGVTTNKGGSSWDGKRGRSEFFKFLFTKWDKRKKGRGPLFHLLRLFLSASKPSEGKIVTPRPILRHN